MTLLARSRRRSISQGFCSFRLERVKEQLGTSALRVKATVLSKSGCNISTRDRIFRNVQFGISISKIRYIVIVLWTRHEVKFRAVGSSQKACTRRRSNAHCQILLGIYESFVDGSPHRCTLGSAQDMIIMAMWLRFDVEACTSRVISVRAQEPGQR